MARLEPQADEILRAARENRDRQQFAAAAAPLREFLLVAGASPRAAEMRRQLIEVHVAWMADAVHKRDATALTAVEHDIGRNMRQPLIEAAVKPGLAEVHVMQAQMLMQQGKTAEAVGLFRQVLSDTVDQALRGRARSGAACQCRCAICADSQTADRCSAAGDFVDVGCPVARA